MSSIKRIRLSLAMGLFLILALGFNLTPLAASQEDGPSGEGWTIGRELAQRSSEWQKRAEARFDSMCVYLGLDEKQKKEARSLYDTIREEMRKLWSEVQSGNLDRTAARESIQKIYQNYQEKFEALLTDEQKAKYEKWIEEHPRRGRQRRG
jgi:Spy/CpxP family protein refolding chaperone